MEFFNLDYYLNSFKDIIWWCAWMWFDKQLRWKIQFDGIRINTRYAYFDYSHDAYSKKRKETF